MVIAAELLEEEEALLKTSRYVCSKISIGVMLQQLADAIRAKWKEGIWTKHGFDSGKLYLDHTYNSVLIEENRVFFSIEVARFTAEIIGVWVDAAFVRLPLHPDSDGFVCFFRIERSDYRI